MKTLFTSLLLVLSCLVAQAQYLYITLPLDRTVLQRNDVGNGSATVVIAGQITEPANPAILPTNFTVKYRLVPVSKTGTLGSIPPWTNIGSSTPYGGVFYTTTTASTGWYQLQVGAFDPIYGGGTPSLTGSVLVGVGEVVFIAGQSNAQGVEGVSNDAVSSTYYDCVNSINSDQFCRNTFAFPNIQKIENGRLITPNSNRSAWGFHYLGKQIVDGLTSGSVTPVLFFNAGSTATSVNNWKQTAYNPTATVQPPLLYGITCCAQIPDWPNSEGPQGQPYKGLKTSLNYFGGMFGARGVIWHQGESDNYINNTEPNYRQDLSDLIAKTRSDFDPRLKWAISRASYLNNTVSGNVTTAQYNVKVATYPTNTSTGAWNSDLIPSSLRQDDGTHFNASGLVAVNDQYYSSYNSGNSFTALKSLEPVPAVTAQNLTVYKNGSSVTLTAPSSNSYCWVQNNGNINNCYSINQIIYVSQSSNSSFRCYVKNSSGNIALTPAVRTPVWTVGGALRIAADNASSILDEGDNVISMYVYPNPSGRDASINFNLTESANIKLEILDLQGRSLSVVAEGPHSAGKHTYPLKGRNLNAGMYFSVLKIGEMFVTNKFVINE